VRRHFNNFPFFQIIEENIPEVEAIDLSDNRLTTLDLVSILKTCFGHSCFGKTIEKSQIHFSIEVNLTNDFLPKFSHQLCMPEGSQ
jgi:hypothetical protein